MKLALWLMFFTVISGAACGADIKIDVVHSSGTKTCSITTNDPNGLTLSPAGKLVTTSTLANPFSGDCLAVAPPPPPPPPGDCSASPPAMPSRVFSLSVKYPRSGGAYYRTTNMRDYNDMLGVVIPPSGDGPPTFKAFPGNGLNQSIFFSMQTNYYIALKFTVPNDFSSTKVFAIQFVQTGFMPQNTLSSMSVSECEGDFKQSLPASCTAQWDGNDGGLITMVGDDYPDPYGTLCKLTRGKTYYLNFVGATLANPSTPVCQTGTCNLGIAAKDYGT